MKSDSFFALIAGVAAGLTLGLLFAPEKGEDTRRKVKAAAAEGWDELTDAAAEGWDKTKEAFGDLREEAQDATSRMRARVRIARRDLKGLRDAIKDQAADLKEDAREKLLAQLDKLEKALAKEVDVPGEQGQAGGA